MPDRASARVQEPLEEAHPAPPGPGAVRLEPEVILPAQLTRHGSGLLQPEKRLMLAVLEDAISTLFAQRRGGPVLAEVEAWFASADDRSPFSFLRICEALGIEAPYLRRGLARVREAASFRTFRRIAGSRNAIGG